MFSLLVCLRMFLRGGFAEALRQGGLRDRLRYSLKLFWSEYWGSLGVLQWVFCEGLLQVWFLGSFCDS